MKICNFKATEAEIARWKAHAAEARTSFSQLCRDALNALVGVEASESPSPKPPLASAATEGHGAQGDPATGRSPHETPLRSTSTVKINDLVKVSEEAIERAMPPVKENIVALAKKAPKKGKCEHRLPKGAYCKSCGKTKD